MLGVAREEGESCLTQLCCYSNKKHVSITTVCRIQVSISQLTIMIICAQIIILYYYDCCDVNNFDACALLTSCLVVYHNNYVLVTEYCVMAMELHDFQFSIACTAQSKTCGGYDHIGKPFI